MFKKNPDGGTRAVLIKESEIRVGAFKDFISFGSTDCENLTCVRDADFSRGDGGFDAGTISGDAGSDLTVATGYCSDKCLEGSVCSSADPNDDNDAKKRLNCRPLLLDSETLNNLCSQGRCLQGDLKSPYFCARGGLVPDSGI